MKKKVMDAVSLAATVDSGVIDLGNCDCYTVQLVYTGTPTGVFKVQSSANGTDFDDVSSATVSPAGAGGQYQFSPATLIGYNYLKIIYTRSSGTGAVNAWVSGKERMQ